MENRRSAPKRPLLAIFLVVLVNLLGFGIIIPLLPFYAGELGASPFVVGLLFASYSLCQVLAAPLLGEASDRYGRRPILLLSRLGTAASFGLLASADTVLLLFAARIVDGLSGGNISTARAYIADVTPEEDRTRVYGLVLGLGFGLGFVLGPALGGLLARFDYAAPAWAAAGLTLAAAALTWAWLPEPPRRASAQRSAPWADLLRLLGRPGRCPLLGIDSLCWAAFGVYQTTFALFVAGRFGFDVLVIGELLAFVGFAGVVAQVSLAGPVVTRLGESKTLAVGLALAGLGLAGAALAQQVVPFVATLVPAWPAPAWPALPCLAR